MRNGWPAATCSLLLRRRCLRTRRRAFAEGGGNLRKDGADRVIQSDIVREANRKGETV